MWLMFISLLSSTVLHGFYNKIGVSMHYDETVIKCSYVLYSAGQQLTFLIVINHRELCAQFKWLLNWYFNCGGYLLACLSFVDQSDSYQI